MPQLMGELDPSRSAQRNAELRDRRWTTRRRFTRVFIVWSDHCAQTEEDIALTPGLPVMYSTMFGAKLITQSFRDQEQFAHKGVLRTVWHVTCQYDSEKDSPEEGEEDQPPEAKTPHVRWYGVQEKWIPELTIDGLPIVNSAGQPYEPEIEKILPVLEIKRYEMSPFDQNTILTYVNTVNSVEFWGAPIGTVLCMPIESERVNVSGDVRENVTYRFKFNPVQEYTNLDLGDPCVGDTPILPVPIPGEFLENTWDFFPYDWGDAELRVPEPASGSDGSLDRITDINDNLVGVFLDGQGLKLGYYNCAPPLDPPVQLEKVRVGPFKIHTRRDFNLLSLGPF